MNDANDQDQSVKVTRDRWFIDHIGRISGVVLGMIGFGFIVFLAMIGFKPAFGIVIFVVAFVLLISLGGRLHGR